MPRYNYECLDCRRRAEEASGAPLEGQQEWEVLFETSHSMNPTPDELNQARECPRCDGHNTRKSYTGVKLHSYIRGYGYLDRNGCHRDMNLYKLTGKDEHGKTTDPYDGMRVPGEVDDLRNRLKRAGKHQPNPTHFVSQPNMERAVREAVSAPAPEPEHE